MDDADVLATWLVELIQPDPNPAIIASLESTAEANGWSPRRALTALLARTDFNPDLHPRGRDGKFIEKFGIVKLLGNVTAPDGRKVDANGRRGVVEGIDPDPRTPGRPNIRVRMIDKDGRPGPPVHAKPDVIEQAPEKARLDKPLDRPKLQPAVRVGKPRPNVPNMALRDDRFDEPRSPAGPPGRPLTTPKRTVVPETPEQRQARADAQERQALANEARTVPEAELDYQTTVGPSQWREAVAREKQARADRRAADQARRQALVDDINTQAAQLSTTDAEARAVGLDGILAKLRFSIIDTDKVHDQLYPPDGSGNWTPERAAQHEEMWNELLANVQAAGIPKDKDALVLGGLPGAGKSYALKPGQQAESFGVNTWEVGTPVPGAGVATHVSISPDIAKELLIDKGMMPEGLSDDLKPLEKVTFLHSESAYLSKLFSNRLAAEGYNVVVDRTFESEAGMEGVMGPLAREGYQFRGLFADIPIDESMESAKTRYLKDALTERGGRFVPSSVQGNRKSSRGNMSKNRDAFEQFVVDDWFTEWKVIDNTGVTKGTPKSQVVGEGHGDGTGASKYLPGQELNPPKLGPPVPEGPAPTIRVVPEPPGQFPSPPKPTPPFAVGGANRATISSAKATVLAQDVIDGKPIDVGEPDIDDVLDAMADNNGPVDLTLVPLFAGMRDKGIPRSQMPQIPPEQTDAFQAKLRADGIAYGPAIVDPLDLKATQSELDGRAVGGIMRAARSGKLDLTNNPMWISNDGFVLDGHHRWGAAAALSSNCGGNGCVEIPVVRIDMPMSELLNYANEFTDAQGIERLEFGKMTAPAGPETPGGSNFSVPDFAEPAPVASGFLAAGVQPPEPDENGNFTMVTDTEDGIDPSWLENLAHGDGSAFGYTPKSA